jgi:hypothetical protein
LYGNLPDSLKAALVIRNSTLRRIAARFPVESNSGELFVEKSYKTVPGTFVERFKAGVNAVLSGFVAPTSAGKGP